MWAAGRVVLIKKMSKCVLERQTDSRARVQSAGWRVEAAGGLLMAPSPPCRWVSCGSSVLTLYCLLIYFPSADRACLDCRRASFSPLIFSFTVTTPPTQLPLSATSAHAARTQNLLSMCTTRGFVICLQVNTGVLFNILLIFWGSVAGVSSDLLWFAYLNHEMIINLKYSTVNAFFKVSGMKKADGSSEYANRNALCTAHMHVDLFNVWDGCRVISFHVPISCTFFD